MRGIEEFLQVAAILFRFMKFAMIRFFNPPACGCVIHIHLSAQKKPGFQIMEARSTKHTQGPVHPFGSLAALSVPP